MSNGIQSVTSIRSNQTQAEKVLALVFEYPFRTSSELSRKVSDEVITHAALHKRLPELRRKGLVKNSDSRICTVTGKTAFTWRVTGSLVTFE